MSRRPASRFAARRSPKGRGSPGSGGSGAGVPPRWYNVQQVTDPGFASAPSWTLSGTAIGTSAVSGGVLQVTSTGNTYFVLPATVQAPLDAGVYTVVYTILNFVAGSISITTNSLSALTPGGTNGTAQTANGTYTENILVATPGYIGLRGRGADIVNNLQVDNMTIVRAS